MGRARHRGCDPRQGEVEEGGGWCSRNTSGSGGGARIYYAVYTVEVKRKALDVGFMSSSKGSGGKGRLGPEEKKSRKKKGEEGKAGPGGHLLFG